MNLLLQAYQTREAVALIASRGECAEVLLPPTKTVHLASTRLREPPTSGRTPLAMALRRAAVLFAQRAAGRTAMRTKRLILLSDGRANVAAMPSPRLWRRRDSCARPGVDAVVVDMEDGPVCLKRASTVARELGATYVQLAQHRS